MMTTNLVTFNEVKFLDRVSELEKRLEKVKENREKLIILHNAFENIRSLTKYIARNSLKKIFEGIAETIYDPFYDLFVNKNKEDKALSKYQNFIIDQYLESKYKKPEIISKENMIEHITDRYCQLFNRSAVRDLRKTLESKSNLEDTIFTKYLNYFADFYFLIGYSTKHETFFEHINLTRKDLFIQNFLSIGEKLFQDFEKLLDRGEYNMSSVETKANLPKYQIINHIDVLNSIHDCLPYHVGNRIDIEDIQQYIDQNYFIIEKPIQTLTLKEIHGNSIWIVLIRCLHCVYYTVVIEEAEQVNTPEVIEYSDMTNMDITIERFNSREEFIHTFTDILNRYDLEMDEELLTEEITDSNDARKPSTSNEIVTVLEELID